ncbi:MAG: hypothetical protein WKF57_11915 [Nakamurella sp.]
MREQALPLLWAEAFLAEASQLRRLLPDQVHSLRADRNLFGHPVTTSATGQLVSQHISRGALMVCQGDTDINSEHYWDQWYLSESVAEVVMLLLVVKRR